MTLTARTAAQMLVAALVISMALVGLATPAAAHVDLLETAPADQAILDAPVDEVLLEFSGEVELAGDGIEVIDEAGDVVPADVSQISETTFAVVPAVELADGAFGVSWTVRAGDAHPRSGTFAFLVDAPQSAETETAPPTSAPPTTDAPTSTTNPSSAPDATTTTTTTTQAPIAVDASANVITVPFATDDPPDGEWPSRAGRFLTMLGVLVSIGVAAFAATALIGSHNEARLPGYWIRRGGVAVLAGVVVELYGSAIAEQASLAGALNPATWIDGVSGSYAAAIALRVVGGLLMLGGVNTDRIIETAQAANAPETVPPPQPEGSDTMVISPGRVQHRFDVAGSVPGLAGIAIAAVSYLFDGHTATAAPSWLVRGATLAHVGAAGVWVGGLLMLAYVLAGRHRRGARLDAAAMAIRFSGMAAIALVAVGVAGLALGWSIVESPREFVETTWGRVLILKLSLVGLAAAMGAYNHRFLVPAIAEDPDGVSAHRLRRIAATEGGILLAIILATAILVGAST